METSFDPKTHTYLIDGKPATGVTTIIGVLAKPNLIPWAARMAVEFCIEHAEGAESRDIDILYHISSIALEEAKSAHTRKKEAAGEHGTSSHSLVEEWIKNRMDNRMSTTDFSPIQKFIDWATENVDHFLFSERKMFNKDLFIAGTADFAYVGKDGERYMADFKTSSGIYGIDYWLQVAAYRMLAEEEGDVPYDGATVVRMGKDGSFEVKHRFDYETDREAFMACLTIYRAQATFVKAKKSFVTK